MVCELKMRTHTHTPERQCLCGGTMATRPPLMEVKQPKGRRLYIKVGNKNNNNKKKIGKQRSDNAAVPQRKAVVMELLTPPTNQRPVFPFPSAVPESNQRTHACPPAQPGRKSLPAAPVPHHPQILIQTKEKEKTFLPPPPPSSAESPREPRHHFSGFFVFFSHLLQSPAGESTWVKPYAAMSVRHRHISTLTLSTVDRRDASLASNRPAKRSCHSELAYCSPVPALVGEPVYCLYALRFSSIGCALSFFIPSSKYFK